jgi:hypothetical protein
MERSFYTRAGAGYRCIKLGARFVEITPKPAGPDACRADFHAALAAFLEEL